MLRFIAFIVYLSIYMLCTLPVLIKVKSLEKKNLTEERDKIVFSMAKRWSHALTKFTRTKVSVRGQENISTEGPVLFVSNHQSAFDILILLGFIDKPKGFVAKIETKKMPIIGSWMKRLPCVFLDRKNVRQSLMAINRGIENLKAGYSLVIFPEGTRSVDGQLLEFKPGSLKLAIKSGVPIIPVTIKNSYKIYEGNGFRIQPAEVEVILAPPIYLLAEDKDANLLAAQIKKIIRSNLSS